MRDGKPSVKIRKAENGAVYVIYGAAFDLALAGFCRLQAYLRFCYLKIRVSRAMPQSLEMPASTTINMNMKTETMTVALSFTMRVTPEKLGVDDIINFFMPQCCHFVA